DLGYFLVAGCFRSGRVVGYGGFRVIDQDAVTDTIILNTALDPLHLGAPPGPYRYSNDQIFALRPDGSGLRQLTSAAGFTALSDGSIRVELPSPFAHPAVPR